MESPSPESIGAAPGRGPAGHGPDLYGRRRAQQGLSIEQLPGAYHVTFREAWHMILRQATADEPEHVGELAYLVVFLWTWFRVLMGNASEAYGEELRRAQVTRATLAHRLFAELTADPIRLEPAATPAQALGYEADGEFQALCLPGEDWPDDRAEQLRHRPTTQREPASRSRARLLIAEIVTAGTWPRRMRLPEYG
ncbi:hypothetical protein [Streptomyces sp. NPDC001970]